MARKKDNAEEKISWENHSEWEGQWWSSCINTYGEEEKQLLYFNRMGLKTFHNAKSPYNFDLGGVSAADIGGGPVSIFLKCVNYSSATVFDPCMSYPQWVADRYALAGINYIKQKGEDIDISKRYDLVMIYNCLQHTEDPHKIINNALAVSKEIRIFEWINTALTKGHPHAFTKEQLNEWLGGIGKTEILEGQANCWGECYYGIFKGNHYE